MSINTSDCEIILTFHTGKLAISKISPSSVTG